PHSLVHPRHIKVAQRTRTGAGRDGSTFEKALQIFIVVVIQTAHRAALAVALHFASHVAVLTAVMSLDCETAVGPQLPLAAETMWRLQQPHQQGGANWTDRRNLAKQLHRRVLLNLPHSLVSRFEAGGWHQLEL